MRRNASLITFHDNNNLVAIDGEGGLGLTNDGVLNISLLSDFPLIVLGGECSLLLDQDLQREQDDSQPGLQKETRSEFKEVSLSSHLGKLKDGIPCHQSQRCAWSCQMRQ